MRKLLINDEWFFAENDDAVIELIEKQMGWDTADAVREIIEQNECGGEIIEQNECGGEIIEQNECGGECDETYKIGEHYRRIIQDVIEELKDITVYKKHEARFMRAVQTLESEL